MLDFSQYAGVDKTGATDSSAAIQAILNNVIGANHDLTGYFPYGTYLLENLNWSASTRLRLQGDGPSTMLQLNSTTEPLITVNGGYFDAQDMTVYAPDGASVGGTFFVMSNGCHSLRRIQFFNGGTLAYWGNGCGGGGADDINAIGMTGSGFMLNVSQSATGQQYGNLKFSRLNFQGGEKNNGVGLYIVSGDTILVSDSNIAGFMLPIQAVTQAQYSYLANMFFTNVLADGAGGPINSNTGWYFDGTDQFLARIFINNCWAGSIANTGMYFKHILTACVSNSEIISNGGTGLIVDTGCRDIRIKNNVITGNSTLKPGVGNGVTVLSGADRVHFDGNRCGPTYNGTGTGTTNDTQGYGIVINSSDIVNYSIVYNDCSGNISGGILDYGGGQTGVSKFVQYNTQGAWNP